MQVLIIEDGTYDHSRSKIVELLGWVSDFDMASSNNRRICRLTPCGHRSGHGRRTAAAPSVALKSLNGSKSSPTSEERRKGHLYAALWRNEFAIPCVVPYLVPPLLMIACPLSAQQKNGSSGNRVPEVRMEL